MLMIRSFSAVAGVMALLLAGCATAHRWGETEDPDWTERVGQATYDQVVARLGQPVDKLPLPSGDMKVRWFARPITYSKVQGTMEDHSVQHTEDRAYWRDMRFDKRGVLTRAWYSDQRELAESEAP
jgi:hypothetical protein